jgi:hypothetical protein
MPWASDYSTSGVHTVLGLVGLVVFIACVILLAAGVTAAVVRISPTRDKKPEQPSESGG